MAKKDKKGDKQIDAAAIESRRKKMEAISTFGLIIIAAAMFAPFASFNTPGGINWLNIGKWIYAGGALIFTFARLVSVSDPRDSLRLRRLRRLEFWAGMCFCVGAFFWFYNGAKYANNPFVGPLAIVRDTVLFSLAGATIQVVASWMIAFRQKKEKQENGGK